MLRHINYKNALPKKTKRGGGEGRRGGEQKREDRKNLKTKQNRETTKKGGGGGGVLSWRAAPSPPSQVGELGGFLNSSLRRMVGGKVRVGGVRLPWPGPVMVAAAQWPSTPVVHGCRGGVGEVS